MDQTKTCNGPDNQRFQEFFDLWIIEQSNLLEELVQACPEGSDSHVERILIPLIEREIKHYELYYNTKTDWAKRHVFDTLHPCWMSNFEDAFLWIGGWRPSTAFQLLYSKSGLQIQAVLDDFLEGLPQLDLGGLSAAQLHELDELQVKTIMEERDTTEKMAKVQDTVADSSMVEWSHNLSEMERATEGEDGVLGNQVESNAGVKEAGLVEILKRADALRLRTLKEIIKILSPIQSAHFLIAAAELHLRVHDLGKSRDNV